MAKEQAEADVSVTLCGWNELSSFFASAMNGRTDLGAISKILGVVRDDEKIKALAGKLELQRIAFDVATSKHYEAIRQAQEKRQEALKRLIEETFP